MSKKPCKGCKTLIDKDASICPHCKTKQGMGVFKKIGLAFVALMVIGYISNHSGTTPPPKPSTPDPTVVDHSLQHKKPDPSSQWSLDEAQDPMTGKTRKTAYLVSANSLSLEFPYQGENKARLMVRQHPRHGTDVIVSVDKGQMLCNSMSCSALVRFDESSPIRFSASEPSDRSSTVMFINDNKRFIELAKKAKKILIQIEFFHNGAQLLEFESDKPLEWASPGKK